MNQQPAPELQQENIIRHKLEAARRSPLAAYRQMTLGEGSLWLFIWYELLMMLIAPLGGGLGYLLRKKLYRPLFKSVGKGLIIGRNVVLRHPGNIVIGDNVTIDDNCMLEGRGHADDGLVLEEEVLINRNVMLLAKGGPIHIGRRSSIGSNSVVVSTAGVELGEAVLTAGGCSISAGAYEIDQVLPIIMDNKAYTNGPIRIGSGTWLGTAAVILDGVTVGCGVVVGAGAIVNKDVEDNMIVVGIPAKPLRPREY